MAQQQEAIRIPSLRAVVVVLSTLTATGVVVFLRRYRGADRTALALDLILSAALCLIAGLAWFQWRFGGESIRRERLREIGLRTGILAGLAAVAVSAGLLAVRWALDQQTSLVAQQLGLACLRALHALGLSLATGLPAYLALGAVVGALIGFCVSEAIGACARGGPGQALRSVARTRDERTSQATPASEPSVSP